MVGDVSPGSAPYDTEKECKKELARILSQEIDVAHEIDRKITLGDYLEKRHAWRVSEAQAGTGLKRRTLATDREIIDLYLKPGLGHLKLVKVTDQRIRDLYAAIRMINRTEGERLPEILRRLLQARAVKQRDGSMYSNRPVSDARIRRIHAVLTGALNDAVTLDKILLANPARGVLRSRGGGRKARKRPLLWTDERVAHWLITGQVPAKVMVWTPVQCGVPRFQPGRSAVPPVAPGRLLGHAPRRTDRPGTTGPQHRPPPPGGPSFATRRRG
ncbi:hypothetical protein [Actinomadura sp. KC216]|uniref:hypothetical protein n=1 Tax=Actinomadura sp. KC216 TaxID=2530370 RepID=UPI001FB66215|nr:hypothetical protein [Actinomadura sp. KC216]